MHYKYIKFPNINPIVFSIYSISLHWYGLMYLIGFFFVLWMGKKRAKKNNIFSKKEIENLIYNGFFGLIIGGRIGYIMFYDFFEFLKNPICLFKIWNGGMSFHGGLIGVIFSIKLFIKNKKYNFFEVSDFIAPLIPFSITLGRIGNFINSELCGKVTINTPWAMLFPKMKTEDAKLAIENKSLFPIFIYHNSLPRHPSQIYEMFFEGIILYIILNIYIKKKRKTGKTSSLFLIFYSIFRFFIEFFRQPDIQIGLIFGFSMGQILSIPMLIFGIYIFSKKNNCQ